MTDDYLQTIRSLSDRIVEAQRPIRILDAIKWDNTIREEFFSNQEKKLPAVDRNYYAARPLGFDSSAKRRELLDLEVEIQRKLGPYNPLGVIMRRMCREYEMVVRMLEGRGGPEFSPLCRQLYGGADDVFHAGVPNMAELSEIMCGALDCVHRSQAIKQDVKDISGEEAVALLQVRLENAFEGRGVRVLLSDGIVSDAAAGSDYLKIRAEAQFSMRDINLLEIHEGLVHMGTTLNGQDQPVCTFLSKGPPSSTVTQEGLAILMEMMAFASSPARLRKLMNRVRAVARAQDGADFLDIYQMFLEDGYSPQESYSNAARVFRGSTPDGAPFTKDIVYTKGFVQIYNYIQLAVQRGLLKRIPLLFCGKTTLEDMRALNQLVEQGIVQPPRYLPPQFADPSALTAWMCYSGFLGRLDLKQIELDYEGIL
ncbi:flavohemoglobin expression-modulating QEGLA motif protein [Lignipirellula cremea]|uniref:Flavohemoglobin expression-modulating QEGLA motif protein n=1 Tax=Lignipirellula cremea TaxID=2528010 RepID=A0A518DSD6_9BACT|nr:flavohemoglobin expression-modulating QEGLA motif protein [Lignipirellula cremea]QDU94744.1 hypothetical protein Pla8534_25500 [Lignipirellula cremea]